MHHLIQAHNHQGGHRSKPIEKVGLQRFICRMVCSGALLRRSASGCAVRTVRRFRIGRPRGGCDLSDLAVSSFSDLLRYFQQVFVIVLFQVIVIKSILSAVPNWQ